MAISLSSSVHSPVLITFYCGLLRLLVRQREREREMGHTEARDFLRRHNLDLRIDDLVECSRPTSSLGSLSSCEVQLRSSGQSVMMIKATS